MATEIFVKTFYELEEERATLTTQTDKNRKYILVQIWTSLAASYKTDSPRNAKAHLMGNF